MRRRKIETRGSTTTVHFIATTTIQYLCMIFISRYCIIFMLLLDRVCCIFGVVYRSRCHVPYCSLHFECNANESQIHCHQTVYARIKHLKIGHKIKYQISTKSEWRSIDAILMSYFAINVAYAIAVLFFKKTLIKKNIAHQLTLNCD